MKQTCREQHYRYQNNLTEALGSISRSSLFRKLDFVTYIANTSHHLAYIFTLLMVCDKARHFIKFIDKVPIFLFVIIVVCCLKLFSFSEIGIVLSSLFSIRFIILIVIDLFPLRTLWDYIGPHRYINQSQKQFFVYLLWTYNVQSIQ